MRHEWGDLCRATGAMQLRDNKRFFEPNVETNAKLKLPLQRRIVLRRCQTSQPNTMQRPCLTCIIHPCWWRVTPNRTNTTTVRKCAPDEEKNSRPSVKASLNRAEFSLSLFNVF